MAGITEIVVATVTAERAVEAYRIVHGSSPTDARVLESLRSNYERDRPPRGWEQRNVVIQMGISMFVRRTQAEGTARRFPVIGDHIAQIRLEQGFGFALARTGPPGHLTVWGRPLQLLGAIVDISPIDS